MVFGAGDRFKAVGRRCAGQGFFDDKVMDTVHMIDTLGTEILIALSLVPTAGYAGMYLLFRLSGKLRVNSGGWHAGAVRVGNRVVASAIGLLRMFQPLLKLESWLARRFRSDEDEEADGEVSDVIVEVVPLV